MTETKRGNLVAKNQGQLYPSLDFKESPGLKDKKCLDVKTDNNEKAGQPTTSNHFDIGKSSTNSTTKLTEKEALEILALFEENDSNSIDIMVESIMDEMLDKVTRDNGVD
jgi:hypothetical protein